jgi:hypothetical protein
MHRFFTNHRGLLRHGTVGYQQEQETDSHSHPYRYILHNPLSFYGAKLYKNHENRKN